ncbi:MAG TPA: hypothetical protein VID30_05250 [Bradyrhizobium sp.]|jgi:hypothetical protein
MTAFYSHSQSSRTLPKRLWLLFGRMGTALRIVHRAIVAARIRRLQRELMFRDRSGNDAELPRPPLMLGDKWDF